MLEINDYLFVDGVIGMNLFNMGLSLGDVLELWNVDEIVKIIVLYKGVVDVGSDLFLINSFGGNVLCLKLYSVEGCVYELNKVVVEIGCEVVDIVGCFVVVVGLMGLIGEIMVLMGSLIYELVVEMFYE